MKKSKNLYLCVSLTLLSLALFGCDTKPPITLDPKINVTYEPPMIPLKISIDAHGEISVSTNTSILTPIGKFSINQGVTFHGKKTLTVIAGQQKCVYELNGENFEFSLPNDRSNRGSIKGIAGNISITIPDPVWQSENNSSASNKSTDLSPKNERITPLDEGSTYTFDDDDTDLEEPTTPNEEDTYALDDDAGDE